MSVITADATYCTSGLVAVLVGASSAAIIWYMPWRNTRRDRRLDDRPRWQPYGHKHTNANLVVSCARANCPANRPRRPG